MSRFPSPADLLDRVSLSSREQLALRAAVPVSTLLFALAVRVSSGELHPVLGGTAVLLSVAAASAPRSSAALALVLFLGATWLLAVPDRLDAWTLIAAVLLAVIHLACTLASYGPPGLTLDRELLRRWGIRLAGCLAAALAVWAAALAVSSFGRPASAVALALGLVVVLCWVAVVRRSVAGPLPPGRG
ncbi:MAG: hypothetical protein QOF53_946 [Nocardioidaceae bacterium]|jgi:hypothetical protein|nr:hypothetical protein [Nocardioidaceae bacterium]